MEEKESELFVIMKRLERPQVTLNVFLKGKRKKYVN